MKAKKIGDTKFVFTGVSNESQLEDVESPAKRAKCKVERQDCCTKIIVTGTKKQIDEFVELYANS